MKKTFSIGYIVLGAILAVIGVLFIVFNNALKILAIVLGILLSVFGIIYCVLALAKRERRLPFAIKIIFSVLCIVCGIVTSLTQSSAIMVISNILFLLFIVDGSFKLNTAILSKRYSVKMWWVMLILAVFIILSSFVLAKITFENHGVLSVLLGSLIIVDGIANIFSSFYITTYDKKREDYYINIGNGLKTEEKCDQTVAEATDEKD